MSHWDYHKLQLASHLLSNHGALLSMIPLFADSTMLSGKGRECLTIAPYKPYSAIIELLPHVFSVLRHLALRFWNQTCKVTCECIILIIDARRYKFSHDTLHLVNCI